MKIYSHPNGYYDIFLYDANNKFVITYPNNTIEVKKTLCDAEKAINDFFKKNNRNF
jgi:hypothetical protein